MTITDFHELFSLVLKFFHTKFSFFQKYLTIMQTIWSWVFISSLFFLAACGGESESTAEETSPSVETLSESERAMYLQEGKSIAGATFAALSGQLQKALQEGGVQNAVDYCNVVAYPLVDSLSKVHDATIRRTSLKIRNPKDTLTPHEQVALESYQQKVENGEQLQPSVNLTDAGTVAFYAPIMTMELCLKCHGKVGEELAQADYELIQELYPEDEAIGYSEGEWRGLWSIEFERE